MPDILIRLGIIIILGFAIYFGFNAWQEHVVVYASGCETGGGTQLPTSVCKWIIDYRYQLDN